jgi:multicomponent Na+:H+ antiporter subunit D
MLLLLPILIPVLTAMVALLVRGSRLAVRAVSVTGAVMLLVAGCALFAAVWSEGPQVLRLGNWPAPFGVVFVADLLSAVLVVLTGLAGLAVTVYSLGAIDAARERFGYHTLLHVLLMGVCGAFLTGDLFNLYVWFEVLLIASFVLLALGGERAQMEGAVKYVTINLLSSALFLIAVGLLYAEAGTLTMAHLAERLPLLENQALLTAIAALLLVAFGIKAAVFPLFFWLPAAYHTPPPVVSAIFAGLLTKVGVYALLRTFTLVFVQDVAFTHTLVLATAGVTMLVGVLGALAQRELRRVLSFLIVSHIGFAILGLGLFSERGLAGAVFYLVEDIVVLTALFLASGVVRELGGDERLDYLGGLAERAPLLALAFFLPALSLAGVPPLSGFFAKLALLRAALEAGHYLVVVAALLTSVLTLLVVLRTWAEVFWKTPHDHRPQRPERRKSTNGARWMGAPTLVLGLLPLVLGLAVGPAFVVAARAGAQLWSPAAYIAATLGR